MVRTGNVDFSCKRLTSIEIQKSKYHIIRRVRFQWEPPHTPHPPRHTPNFKLPSANSFSLEVSKVSSLGKG